jgi:hypothetical protein
MCPAREEAPRVTRGRNNPPASVRRYDSDRSFPLQRLEHAPSLSALERTEEEEPLQVRPKRAHKRRRKSMVSYSSSFRLPRGRPLLPSDSEVILLAATAAHAARPQLN